MQRKKTVLRAHRTVSPPNHESGLIVTAKNARRSARTTRAVDNRSHRTPELLASEPNKMRAKRATAAPLTATNVSWTADADQLLLKRSSAPARGAAHSPNVNNSRSAKGARYYRFFAKRAGI
jgi:hypothetical protein